MEKRPLRRTPWLWDHAMSPIVAGVVLVIVTASLGAVATHYFVKFARDQPTAQITGFHTPFEETRATSERGPVLTIMPLAGQPILLSKGDLTLIVDGAYLNVPLVHFKNKTADGVFWRAGDEICLVGPTPDCLRARGDVVDVAIVVSNQLLHRATHYLRAFEILPSGGVLVKCAGPVQVLVVGADITYGANGPPIPVRVDFTKNNGTSIAPLFNNAPVAANMEWTDPNVPVGSILGIRGRANYANFNQAYFSFQSDPHVKVLKDGDAAPNVPAFGSQTSIETFLRPYVDPATRTMTLAYNEVIFLVEFNPSLTSAAADFQDLVVLMRFPVEGC